MRELHLFAGAGGGILGGLLLGHTCVCAVEIEPYCRDVLLQRQRDGLLPRFPIWDDVRTFDGRPWRGRVDVVCGGFPCQDISSAGKGAGITGERSSLWSEMARIIREVGPRVVFVENSSMLALRGLDRVLGDLASLGFDARWGVVSAQDAGLPHLRERLWILADSMQGGQLADLAGDDGSEGEDRPTSKRCGDRVLPEVAPPLRRTLDAGWNDLPDASRAIDGFPAWVDRLAATGNAQVASVAALAWRTLVSGKA